MNGRPDGNGGGRRVCLVLPTNRECLDVLPEIAEEARYAAERFGVTVVLLILDSAAPADREAHATVLAALPAHAGVAVLHLDEADQRHFLRTVVAAAGVAEPDLIAELMLPGAVSYGACTNRAFLVAAALGCASVHRRDSDSGYQVHDGAKVFPIDRELAVLGRPADEAAAAADRVELDPPTAAPVVLAGASFVGDLSVDIAEIRALDPGVYHDIVSLWAPGDATDEQRRALVAESFRGSGAPFTGDDTTLTVVDPMRVDMCNIAFAHVQERYPLPPATDTIGSDYFLFHLIHSARLPGALHRRDIVNFHTAERKTHAGFLAYQRRLVKFFLSMPYLHFVYRGMAAIGPDLTERDVVHLVRESSWLPREENMRKLDSLDASYRRLGGRYLAVADDLAARRDRLLTEARRDMDDFALLLEAWPALIAASRTTPILPATSPAAAPPPAPVPAGSAAAPVSPVSWVGR